MKKLDLNEVEILEALKKSGFLLKSEISEYLASRNFFVENSQVIANPFTGSSRAVDIIAEYYQPEKYQSKQYCVSKARLIIEILNNDSPIVLLSKFTDNPNIATWTGIKVWRTFPEGKNLFVEGFAERILDLNKIYTHYCSFLEKTDDGQLIAIIPDNIHEGLSKITQYCEECTNEEEEEQLEIDNYWREFFYLPILVINDNLFELNNSPKGYILNKVESSVYIFNYHYNKKPSMSFVYVATKDGLPNLIDSILQIETDIYNEMIACRYQKQ